MRKPRNSLSQGALYTELRKLAEPKKRKKKSATEQPAPTRTYPSLTLRQANILLALVADGMSGTMLVDGQVVTGSEWVELIRELVR